MAESREIGSLRTRLSWEDDGANRSLEGFKRDLRGLRSEMSLAKSGGKEYTNSLRGMRDQSDVLTRKFKTQKEQARELKRRYDELVAAGKGNTQQAKNLQSQYNNTTAQMNRTEQQLKRLNSEIRRQESPWTKVGQRMETTGATMQKVGRGMSTTGRKMTTRVTAPLLGIAGAALKTGMDFEEGMSKVKAISGATGDDMTKLEEQARKMGAETRYSASEAAEGMSYLAMAGFDTNEIMETMPGLLDLAASANMDLGRAADIASNVISGFGMEASEAGHVSDVLAASAANANTNVEQMGDAMSYVAPVAKGAGLSMEETAAAIGTLSDSGIQGQRAGTALRKVISSLQNPTGQAADAIEDMGLSMEEVDPSAHSLSEILETLEDAGMDSSQAMELVGEQAGPGLIALLEEGSGGLKDFTKDMKDSDGAAKEMADTMEDNAKGSWREFKSAAQEAGISLSEHMLPAVTDMIESGTELARKFGDLDDSTQKNIIKFGGLAAAAGPAALVLGNVTTAAGGVVRVGGKLFKTLGKKGGAGLLGSLGGLSKAGVAGLAIAGVGGLAYGLKKLNERSNETRDVNLETTHSLSDQAGELDENVQAFESLSDKAKLSNDELAEMHDLNQQIAESSNPTVIEQLKERYDELADKSGLSKDEIKKLFGANDDIIEQSPEVEKSISDQGNEFVNSTDAVKDYVQELYEMSRQELSDEMVIAEEKKQEILKENKQYQQDINTLNERSRKLRELESLSEEERNQKLQEWHHEIQQELAKKSNSQDRYNELKKEEEIVNGYISEGIGEGLEKIKQQREELNKKVDKNEEELEKIDTLDSEMTNILLKQSGINEEGEKGLSQLDEKIEKEKHEISKLEAKRKKNGELTQEEQKQLGKLKEKLNKHEEAKQKIFEETGQTSDLNKTIDDQIKKLKGTNKKYAEGLLKTTEIKAEEGNIFSQLVDKNKEYDKQIKKLEKSYQKNGELTEEQQEHLKKLRTKKKRNANVIDQILKMIGLNKDERKEIINSNDALKSQNTQIGKNNDKTEAGIQLEVERTDEAGKKVSKTVTVLPSIMPDALNDDLETQAKKMVKIGMNPIGSSFNIPLLTSNAKGTGKKGHPGGLSLLNDGKGNNAGQEIVQTPDGNTGMFKGKNVIADLPKGSHVWSAKETKDILGSIPKYAKGTDNPKMGMTFKGVTNKGLSMLKAASIGMKAMSGISPNLLPVLAQNLTSNPDKAATVFQEGDGINPFGSKFTKSSGYGPRGLDGFHKGIDFAAKTGTPIKAATGGTVKQAGFGTTGSGYGGYGNVVSVVSGNHEILYGHMSGVSAKQGSVVKPGDVIGFVGSTGQSTGPHVHFEARKKGTMDTVNPSKFLESGSGGKNSGGKVGNWISRGMSKAHVSGSGWKSGLSYIIGKESSGNPKAVGAPTTAGRAKGLMQLKSMNISGNPFDPVNNVHSGINYIKSRYGSIKKAVQWWKAHRWYAKGTEAHPGGSFVAGEKGWELGRLGDQWELLNKGMYDRPRGYEVYPHEESKKMLRAINNIPGYAKGTGNTKKISGSVNNNSDLLEATQEQNEILSKLLAKDGNVYLYEGALAKGIVGIISDLQNRQEVQDMRDAGTI